MESDFLRSLHQTRQLEAEAHDALAAVLKARRVAGNICQWWCCRVERPGAAQRLLSADAPAPTARAPP